MSGLIKHILGEMSGYEYMVSAWDSDHKYTDIGRGGKPVDTGTRMDRDSAIRAAEAAWGHRRYATVEVAEYNPNSNLKRRTVWSNGEVK